MLAFLPLLALEAEKRNGILTEQNHEITDNFDFVSASKDKKEIK